MAKRKGSLPLVLDLGTNGFRLLRLDQTKQPQPGEVHLKSLATTDSPREFAVSTFIENPIMDAAPVEKALKNIVTQLKPTFEDTIVLLPDHAALINMMVAPSRYSRKEMEEAVKEDLAPVMPLPIDQWNITFQTIGRWEEDDITIALAIVKPNLLEVGAMIQNAGVNPQVIDLNIFNDANLIESYLIAEENKGKNIALVHLGNETTSIAVLRDGIIRTLVNRPVGGSDFTKQISKHFHVPEPDAEQFKRNEVFFLPETSPEQEGLYNYTVIKNTFSGLVREIFGALESYLSKFREFSINEVIIAGGGANFQNIHVLLAGNLNIPVRPIADFYRLTVAGRELEAPDRNVLSSACGAFLRE